MGASSGFDNNLTPRSGASTSPSSVASRRRAPPEVNSASKALPFCFASPNSTENRRTGGTPSLRQSAVPSAEGEAYFQKGLAARALTAFEGALMDYPSPCEAMPDNPMEASVQTESVPVFVMLPLDTVNAEGKFKYIHSPWFHEALHLLAMSGVKGVAVDVWWGAVEKRPRMYDWSGYRDLVELIKRTGLSLQVVLSFHACGGNVGDIVQIPLPQWVLQCGECDPDIFMRDRPRDHHGGRRSRECLSFFADEAPGVLRGRSPIQCYADFMAAFRDAFEAELGPLITDVVVGSGPCGELRYPSYSEANGWRFPGVGEFQCYDRYALSSLAKAASDIGHKEWGYSGPHDAGEYNNWPRDAGFFCPYSGSWDTSYGRFFLQWYSDSLLQHGRRMLKAATAIFASKLRQRPNLARTSESVMHGVKAWLAKTGGRLCSSPSTTSATDLRMSDGSVSARTNSKTSVLRDASLDSIARDTTLSCTSCQSGIQLDAISCYPASTTGEMGCSSVFDVETGVFAPICSMPPLTSPPWDGTSLERGWPMESDRTPSTLGRKWDAGEKFLRRFMCFSSKHSTDERINNHTIQLGLKIAGVHWWYRTRSHAAELTAGYYNAGDHCGYEPIIAMCREFDCGLTLTCVEMCDQQHPPETCCSPQGLVNQIRRAAAVAGVRFSGENALPLFYPGQDNGDANGLDRIVETCRGKKVDLLGSMSRGSCGGGGSDKRKKEMQRNNDYVMAVEEKPGMHSFTFLRLGPEIMSPSPRRLWSRFMQRMREPQHQQQQQQTIHVPL